MRTRGRGSSMLTSFRYCPKGRRGVSVCRPRQLWRNLGLPMKKGIHPVFALPSSVSRDGRCLVCLRMSGIKISSTMSRITISVSSHGAPATMSAEILRILCGRTIGNFSPIEHEKLLVPSAALPSARWPHFWRPRPTCNTLPLCSEVCREKRAAGEVKLLVQRRQRDDDKSCLDFSSGQN